jgi:hypothetical protein
VRRSATYLLIEMKLGESLADYVTRHRNDERTWAYIARKLREATDNTVSFSDEALRKWFTADECSERAA